MDESFKVVEDDKVPRNEVHAYINGKKVGVITNIALVPEEGRSLDGVYEMPAPPGPTPEEVVKLRERVDARIEAGVSCLPAVNEHIASRMSTYFGVDWASGRDKLVVTERRPVGEDVSYLFQGIGPMEYIDLVVDIGGKDEGEMPSKT